jgi:hypothetical protein
MWKLQTLCLSLVVWLRLCGELWVLVWGLVLAQGIDGKVFSWLYACLAGDKMFYSHSTPVVCCSIWTV